MINFNTISRINRYIINDKTLPFKCFSKWWYNDITEKCKCNYICKYTNFTKQDFIKNAENNYKKLCKISPKEM
jgi:hypothetical protein